MGGVPRRPWSQSDRRLSVLAAVTVVVAGVFVAMPAAQAADPCSPLVNAIACENSKPGAPASEWDISGAGEQQVQGFATDISVNVGQTIDFKIDSGTSYTIDIYRLGYYGGNGARKVASVVPSVPLPQNQPACITDAATEIFDCGNWAVSASWPVPATAVSGVYIAKLTAGANTSHITFIVRDDSSQSDMIFQTSDTTWQAYNRYGGSDFYSGGAHGRAYKLSYNRPFATRDDNEGRDFLFSNEYPMIRFLERNGYDVTYTTGVDSDRRGSLLLNHKIFISTGHDEYWSGAQRANVEAARDAGVNLAFFSGNEVYWRTRWEPSQDGSGTQYRTLVCYKETWAGGKLDPSSEWTGTWRDPRFATPAQGGGLPENALTGTAYLANHDDLPITVPANQGAYRLWRNTDVATRAAAGQPSVLAEHTVGYESDEDLDNGFAPPGLIHLSTTVGESPQILQDYGVEVAPGSTTHHMTMYRAASGALVFSAGTVQYAWALDSEHDGISAPADVNIQQATVNLFADMGVAPATLMSGLVPASASADTTAPTTTIDAPAAGTVVPRGSQVTLQGTASDSAHVASVEVSIDGGATWRRATGTTTWSYTFVAAGTTSLDVQVRGVDDSLNLATPTVRSYQLTGPHTIFGSAAPAVAAINDSSAVELGVRVTPQINGFITGVRFYKSAGNTGTHTGSLWSSTGTRLATSTFTGESATGWQTLTFASPVVVTAGTTYVVSYFAPNGNYAADLEYFIYRGVESGPLSVPRSTPTVGNGIYRVGSGFPNATYRSSNYWVDAVFVSADVNIPAVVSATPAADATSVPVSVAPSATFSKNMDPASVQFELRAAGAATPVAGATSYNATTRTVTFTPTAALALATRYVASATGSDTDGNAMGVPYTWAFTTELDPAAMTLFAVNAMPAVEADVDASAIELGVRFVPSVGGTVAGVRYYQGPGNTGTHVGSLWTASGARLAQVTFPASSGVGWQVALFDTPVEVTAGATYVVSYYAPNGRYASTSGFFSSPWVNGLLTAPAGGNGVYRYGSGGGFPTNTYGATNYWVDVVFSPGAIAGTTPAPDATSVPVSVAPSATFAEDMNPASVQFDLRVAGAATPVAGSAAYQASSRTVTFTPTAALSTTTRYVASVTGTDTDGNAMSAPYTWAFTTELDAAAMTLFAVNAMPAVEADVDGGSIELGVRFVPSVTGTVGGVRYYQGPGNTGTHVGSLWTASGARLALVTFPASSGVGWQVALFDTPVAVTAGTTYVVSYYAPNGHYASTSGFFSSPWVNGSLTAPAGGNGVYRYGSGGGFPTSTYGASNYWVDVVFYATQAPPPEPSGGVFLAGEVPQEASWPEATAIEVGMAFTSDVAGQVTGVRFYKGNLNTGAHTGSLWSSSGVLLATGTFTAETESGWQTLILSTPVTIAANTTYVVSYYTNTGYYAATPNMFSAGLDRPPLHVVVGGGRYRYGSSGYPSGSTNHNFWVDVVFTTA